MTRVSRQHISTFKENVKIARGFMKLRYYITDLLETGGGKSVGQLTEWADQMMETIGFGFKSLSDRIAKDLGSEIQTKIESMGKDGMMVAAKTMADSIRPAAQEIMVTVDEVRAAVERGLLQQSIVIAVSALEVYLHDVTVDVVAKNRYIERRFTSRLEKEFGYRALQRAGEDIRKAFGETVADSYHFYDPKSVRRHLREMLGGESPIESQADLKRLGTIIEYRHLVTHRAGRVDSDFRKKTGYRGKTGESLRVTHKFVDDALDFIMRIATKVQEGLEAQRAGG